MGKIISTTRLDDDFSCSKLLLLHFRLFFPLIFGIYCWLSTSSYPPGSRLLPQPPPPGDFWKPPITILCITAKSIEYSHEHNRS
jgi:hypothetical protein